MVEGFLGDWEWCLEGLIHRAEVVIELQPRRKWHKVHPGDFNQRGIIFTYLLANVKTIWNLIRALFTKCFWKLLKWMWLKVRKINYFLILSVRLKPAHTCVHKRTHVSFFLWNTNYMKTYVPQTHISLNVEIWEAFLLKSGTREVWSILFNILMKILDNAIRRGK